MQNIYSNLQDPRQDTKLLNMGKVIVLKAGAGIRYGDGVNMNSFLKDLSTYLKAPQKGQLAQIRYKQQSIWLKRS